MALNLRKVLISDEVDQICVDILQESGIEVVKNTKLSQEQLIAEIPKYDGLIVRSATKATADVIAAGSSLKIIGRAGTGVDNIDCKAATKKGIIVMNTPGGNTLSAAEHTCTLLLAMSRHVSNGTESLRAGRWDRKKYMGNEVYGKTLAIIGLGRIGQEVATRMQAFGMTTIGYDPITPPEVAAKFNIQWLPLEELWPRADFITVHTPLIPQTKNLINDEVFSKCKKGVRIINCARGGIVDEEALVRALNNGQCAAAGLDVFLQEPPVNTALIQHPLVTSTPHLGASTIEAQTRVAEDIAKQIVDAVQGKSLVGAINAQALSNALSEETRPWVALGSALGSLVARLQGQVTKEMEITLKTAGASLKKAASFLSAAALVGLLKPQSQNGLNLISAPAYAKELGVQIQSQHEDDTPAGRSEQVTILIQQPGGASYSVTGTVVGKIPTLLEINGASFTQGVTLTGDFLVYRSKTSPQVLAAVTGALSSCNRNVLSFISAKPTNGEMWNIMHVTPALDDLDLIKGHVSCATILSL